MGMKKIFAAMVIFWGLASLGHAETAAGGAVTQSASSDAEVSQTRVEIQGLVSIGENIAIISSQVRFQVPGAGVSSLVIELPKDVNVTAVQGLYIKGREASALADKQQVKLFLERPVRGDWTLHLTYEKLIPKDAVKLDFPFMELPGVKSTEAKFGVEALSSIEIKILQYQNVKQLDLSQVPESVASQTQGVILLGFSYSAIGGVGAQRALCFSINKYQDVQVIDAMVDDARYLTLCQDNGFCVTKAILSVRNKSRQFLKVTLPKEAEVWITFLVDNPVRPSRNAQGDYLIPLTRSDAAMSGMEDFPVEIVYASSNKKWGATGRNAVELPKMDMVVREMNWVMFLPKDYDYRGFEGMDTVLIKTKIKRADDEEVKKLLAVFVLPLAAPNFLRFQASAKQSEAKQNLGAIYSAQQDYFSKHGYYARTFAEAGWEPKGSIRYSYYMGDDYVGPAVNAYPAKGLIKGTRVDNGSFQAVAVGNIDNEPTPDIWMIDQDKKLVNPVDDVKLDNFGESGQEALELLRKRGVIADIESIQKLPPVRVGPFISGPLPIKIDIPQEGRLYQFKKLFPEQGAGKKAPQVSFWYFPINMAKGAKGFTWVTLAGMLVIGIGAAIGYARRHPDGSQKVVRGAGKTVKYIFLGWIALQFAGCGVMMLAGLF